MWLFAARGRSGHDGAAQLATQTRSWPSASWPYPVIQQMRGKMSAADARAAASNDDERCEADFYNGELTLTRDVESAKASFQRALAECPPGFVEREGADAEWKRLDRRAAAPEGQVVATPPPTPEPEPSVATPPPAPEPEPSGAASPPDAAPAAPTVPKSAAPPTETVRAFASASASISGKVTYSGMAVWSFVDRGPAGSELDADLIFGAASIHGELSLRRLASGREPAYQLVFLILASDRAAPPLSQLDNQLGAPTVAAPGSVFRLADDAPFARIDDTTYRAPIPAGEIQKDLSAVTRGKSLSIKLGVSDPQISPPTELTLRLELDAKIAHVVNVAAEAWK
jgi:hypothetical protein